VAVVENIEKETVFLQGRLKTTEGWKMEELLCEEVINPWNFDGRVDREVEVGVKEDLKQTPNGGAHLGVHRGGHHLVPYTQRMVAVVFDGRCPRHGRLPKLISNVGLMPMKNSVFGRLEEQTTSGCVLKSSQTALLKGALSRRQCPEVQKMDD
jgi:hypothetical protein